MGYGTGGYGRGGYGNNLIKKFISSIKKRVKKSVAVSMFYNHFNKK